MEKEDFSSIVGKVFQGVNRLSFNGDEGIEFVGDNERFRLCHMQDCCEDVRIEDICGDLSDLEGNPILMANEVSHQDDTNYGSMTWTFYNIATIKGSVTIRFLGQSNGYYSEEVDFYRVEPDIPEDDEQPNDGGRLDKIMKM